MFVKVISKEIIKPSVPTPRHLRYHSLSLLDHVNGPVLMPLIFFYSSNLSINNRVNNKTAITTMLTRLKESLATTLSIFYPLAGRIEGTNNYVDCKDEGVPYVQGRVDYNLSDIVNKVEVSELDKLLPIKPYGPSKLISAIQVSVFACGGIAIALCINHKTADAYTQFEFIKTWSIIARGETGYILPCFHIAQLFPLTSTVTKFEFENEEAVSKRFTFDAACIRALKKRYYHGKNNVSSGLLLIGFIYNRIVSTSKSRGVSFEVSQAVNIRSKINHSPLKKSFYFGNAYVNAMAKSSMVHKNANICLEMVERMQEATTKIDTNFMVKIRHGIEDLSFVTKHYERSKIGEIVSIGFTNFSGLPIYESDFGCGKPVWVTTATLAMTNVITLIPSLSRSHVDVYVCLSQENMKKLESDQEFITSFAKAHLCSKL